MPKKKKVEKKETVELSTEEIKAEVARTQERIEEAEKAEVAEEKPEEPTKEEKEAAKTLEDKLYDIYKASPPGALSIGMLLGETGLAKQHDSRTGTALLSDAWVQLHKKGKVPSTQFVKPA